MLKEITCISCPLGCQITVEGTKKKIKSICGVGCKRGEKYAVSEFINPLRMLTTTVKLKGGTIPLLPVKTTHPIPKDLLNKSLAILKKKCVSAPVKIGEIIEKNILKAGVDIVATRSIRKK